MVLQTNGNYHRFDYNSTGIYPTLFVGFSAINESPDESTRIGIFLDVCHYFSNVGDADYWSCSQHYPLIYHSKISIEIIYVNSFI